MSNPLLLLAIVGTLLITPIPFDDLLIPNLVNNERLGILVIIIIIGIIWYYKSGKK